jgi:D-3-phosphoglycerate dehydrogenase
VSHEILLAQTPRSLAYFFSEAAMERLGAIARVGRHGGEHALGSEALADEAGDARLIVTDWYTGADAAFFARCSPHLLALVRAGVEIRNIDLAAATAAGVLVVNTPGLYVRPVVELTIGFMVALARRITAYDRRIARGELTTSLGRAVHDGKADELGGFELGGQTLGLVGLGEIGVAVARAADALGMQVLTYDPYARDLPGFVAPVALEDLLGRARFVSLHAVLNASTTYLIGEAELRRMRPDAYLINTARGALVDNAALARALADGRIAGAALDVFEGEPEFGDNPLLAPLPDVIRTPHIGGITPETMARQAWRVVEIAADVLAGRVPAGVVNTEVLGRSRMERIWMPE